MESWSTIKEKEFKWLKKTEPRIEILFLNTSLNVFLDVQGNIQKKIGNRAFYGDHGVGFYDLTTNCDAIIEWNEPNQLRIAVYGETTQLAHNLKELVIQVQKI